MMGKLVDDFLATPIPDEVWHYTNLSGFKGILSSGRLWATDARYATDSTELVHAQRIAKIFLEAFVAKDEAAAHAKRSMLGMVDQVFNRGALSQEKSQIFIASFCAVDDLKSQWMEYADQGRGVSLSFDLRHVRPPKHLRNAVTFAPCAYAPERQELLLRDALRTWAETIEDLHRKTGSTDWAAERFSDWRIIDRIYGKPFSQLDLLKNNNRKIFSQLAEMGMHTTFDLLRIASHCKNTAFDQEEEWRLALPHWRGKPISGEAVLYRGTNKDIPYIAHNLFASSLPLNQVRIGPLCNDLDQIREALLQAGYNIPITKSCIPLRARQ